jgi:hypothetical protein
MLRNLKSILLCSLPLFLLSCNRAANYDLIGVCRTGDNLRIDYMDKHSITKIDATASGDTIKLTITTRLGAMAKDEYVIVPKGFHYVTFGNTTKNIDELDTCAKVYGGKEALEHLKTFK